MGGHCPDVVLVLEDVLGPPSHVQHPGNGEKKSAQFTTPSSPVWSIVLEKMAVFQ